MIVEFDKSFFKSLSKIKNNSLLNKIKEVVIEIEESKNLKTIRNVKKLYGYKNYYRVRIGDYRLGFETIYTNTVRLIIIKHRKEIYKQFP